MRYLFIFICTWCTVFSIPIQKSNPWYPAYTKLTRSDFTILENSYSTLKADPLDNPLKNRKDILLLSLSYLYQKDLKNFRELFLFFLLHIEQRDGDELISYIPAFIELLKFQKQGLKLQNEITLLLKVFDEKVTPKELAKHPLYRFYYSKLIAHSITKPIRDGDSQIANSIHTLQKGLAFKSSYCLLKQSSLLMNLLNLGNKLNKKEVTENKMILASWIQTTKFAHAEVTLLMADYQSIHRPSLYQHKEYKKAISFCTSIFHHYRSKVLYFLRKKSFHEKQLPGIYKNRAYSLHRFYTSSNSQLQKVSLEIENPIVKTDCISFSNEFKRHANKYNLLSDKPIESFDSSVDLEEALTNYRRIFIQSKVPFQSENMIQSCLKISPITYE